MNGENKELSLFDLYVQEVGRSLPWTQRKDIQQEIRSLLEDTLEGRLAGGGDQDEEQAAQAVLREFGPPDKMAQSYAPRNFLIGPKVYPAFMLGVYILVLVSAIQIAVGITTSLWGTGLEFSQMLLVLAQRIPVLLHSAMGTFGSMVLVFWFLERILPETSWTFGGGHETVEEFRAVLKGEVPEKVWDPASLRKLRAEERIKPAGLIFEAALLIGLLVLFNFYPQWVGAFNGNNDGFFFVPLLAESFSFFLPWVNAFWGLSLALTFWLVVQGRKTRTERWLQIGLKVFALLILFNMLVGPPVVGLNPEYLEFHQVPESALRFFADFKITTIVFKAVIGGNLIGHGIALVGMFLKALRMEKVLVVSKA